MGGKKRFQLWPDDRRGRIRLAALVAVPCVGAIAYALWNPGLDVTDGRHDRRQNALWISHGWLGDNRWFTENDRDVTQYAGPERVSAFLDGAAAAHVRDLYAHLSPAGPKGVLPGMDEARARAFLEAAGAHPGGPFRVFLWVGGVLDVHCFPDDPRWRSAFADSVRAALERYPDLAGVQINVEPCPSGHAGFLALLKDLRGALPKGKLLSVAAYPPPTVWHRHPDVHWDEAYFRAVAARCDQMAVMLYDTALKRQKLYIRLMADWTRETLAWSGGTPVVLGMPVYDDADSVYHDPGVENLENALAGIHAGLADGGASLASYQGVGVYADWEFDKAERAEFRRRFLAPDPATTVNGGIQP